MSRNASEQRDRPDHGAFSVRPIAIVGGGVSGVVTAAVLTAAGFEVTLFEKVADIGGVWSASRAYPGIATQDDRRSYVFSGQAMPEGAAQHPTGAQVRSYLEDYLRTHGVDRRLRLSTEVTSARLVDDAFWEVEYQGSEGRGIERFDWLVIANGMFSTPYLPTWEGLASFEAAGGQVVAPGTLADGSILDGKHVAVVGWGKTACDVAVVASSRSVRTEVIARRLTWKYPKQFGATALSFRHIVLTRAGERLVGTAYRGENGRVLLRRLPERLPRLLLGRLLAEAVDRETGVGRLGLRSTMEFRASTSIVTDGFFEAVRDGAISVHRDRTIARLGGSAEGPWVELDDGRRFAVDLVVAATGYEWGVPFLSDEVLQRAVAHDGALQLHRRVLAVDIPRLAFVGWIHNYRSPITAEVLAVWLAGVLLGRVKLPSAARQRRSAARFPIAADPVRESRTGSLPGVRLPELDRLLRELGTRLPWRVRVRQIWSPIDPSDYAEPLARAMASTGRVDRERSAAAGAPQ